MKYFASLLVLFCAFASITSAQAQPVGVQDLCQNELKQARQAQDQNQMRGLLDPRLSPACFAKILLLRKDAHILNTIVLSAFKEATKNVQQNGSSSGSGGTTNLLSKGLVSKLLSVANEYGAITQTSSGQTTTISGTLDGIPLALEAHSQGLIVECPLNIVGDKCINSRTLDWLGRFSYSVAINTAQASQVTASASGPASGTAQLATFNANGNPASVSQITGKFVMFRPKVEYTTLTNALQNLEKTSTLQQNADAFAKAAKALRSYQENAAGFDAWRNEKAQQLLQATSDNQLLTQWQQLGDSLAQTLEAGSGHPTDDELTQAALTFAAAYGALGSAERQFFTSAKLAKPILTLEYDENRPLSQPSNSVFRLIYSQQISGWTLTGNGAFSFYDSQPSNAIPSAGRIRDWQLAAEGDHDLPKLSILGIPTFTAAYYFQYQTSPSILDVKPSEPVPGITFIGLPSGATQIFSQKGNINVGQLRISFGQASSGLRVPLSFTASNRTELIAKPTWRGQIGISYDFDALFAK